MVMEFWWEWAPMSPLQHAISSYILSVSCSSHLDICYWTEARHDVRYLGLTSTIAAREMSGKAL